MAPNVGPEVSQKPLCSCLLGRWSDQEEMATVKTVVSKLVTMKSEQENTITGYDQHHNLSGNSENSGVETGYDEIRTRKHHNRLRLTS